MASNRFAGRNEVHVVEEPVVQKNTQQEEKNSIPKKEVKISSDGRKKAYKTKTKTFSLVVSPLEEAQKQFKIKQIEGTIHSKMTFGMYLSDLLYQDINNGEHLFDYKTLEIIGDIE